MINCCSAIGDEHHSDSSTTHSGNILRPPTLMNDSSLTFTPYQKRLTPHRFHSSSHILPYPMTTPLRHRVVSCRSAGLHFGGEDSLEKSLRIIVPEFSCACRPPLTGRRLPRETNPYLPRFQQTEPTATHHLGTSEEEDSFEKPIRIIGPEFSAFRFRRIVVFGFPGRGGLSIL